MTIRVIVPEIRVRTMAEADIYRKEAEKWINDNHKEWEVKDVGF